MPPSRTPFSAARALWRVLPEPMRASGPARGLKRLLRVTDRSEPVLTPASPSLERAVCTTEDLDAALREVDAAFAVSDDAARRVFETFAMRYAEDVPPDPDSQAYRARQFDLYTQIHGMPYQSSNEATDFDAASLADRPFPYHNGSAQTVGGQLIAIGYLIRQLDLPAGSRVLDVGAGWGNTTIALARMGYRVTALDIEPRFLQLIEERARRKHLVIETVRGDSSDMPDLDRRFDAVVFFESFHHCSHHQRLVAALDRLVAPGGQVAFAGEPIWPDFPLPWGLRLDGQSLWAIRRHGWLELGFREDYFANLLARHGWTVRKSICTELTGAQTGWGTVFVARRRE